VVLAQAIDAFFDQPPGTSLIIIGVAIVISLGTNLISLRFTDKDQLKVYRRMQREFSSLRMKVQREGDKRLTRKFELLEKEMKRKNVNQELQSMQMKPLLFIMIPMLVVFGLLNSFFAGKLVAILPFPLPLETLIIIPLGKNVVWNGIPCFRFDFIGWYFAVNITIGAVIRKLAGLDPH
jgi:uncharacterized membrane protein (DUF106 family)